DRAKAYAAATNDDNPAYESGKYAPPIFGVVPTWDAMLLAAADVIPPDALPFIVHGEQDMHFHQPLVPGAELTTAAEAHSVRVGLPGIIVHGLCTMAMCSQAVVKTVAGGDPSRLRRLAVRFSKPVLPGNDVVTTIYDIGNGAYAFEATSAGSTVIKDGRAEVA